VHITLPAEGSVLNVFLIGNSRVAILWTAVLTPARSSDTTSRHQWWCYPGNCHLQPHRSWQTSMFLCEHSWEPSGTNFIFQRCHHHFQCIEANIQLCTQFPSRNPPIRMDELIEMLLMSWCDSCAWPSRTWLVFHVTVTTTETHHPPPHCANIHCSVSVNLQKVSMNVIGCAIFSAWRNSITHLCFIYTSMSDSPSTVICHMATKFNGILVGRFNLYCHNQHLPLMSWANLTLHVHILSCFYKLNWPKDDQKGPKHVSNSHIEIKTHFCQMKEWQHLLCIPSDT
jgi:hypothetical protein